MQVYNFFAGPAILPKEVLEEASHSAREFHNGLSILEMSHRSAPIVAVFEEAEQLIMQLLGLSQDYNVLFLTGGASSQFYMIPMNLLASNQTAGYIDTGTWAANAIKEAKLFGNVEVLASSSDRNYNYIPKPERIPDHLKYLHFTSNNTIHGTQLHDYPETNVPLVCDMSSDIFSKPIDGNRFDLIYAGAQKNLGPAGVTLLIVKKDIVGKMDRHIPTMLNYKTHIAKNSMFNTPPVFPVYVSLLTLRWLIKNGGLAQMQKINDAKADLLYREIDRNPLFKGTTTVEDRSKMNVCFLLNDDTLNEAFLKATTDGDCIGLKGHRSVGGFRASIYNAMPLKGVEVLVDVMREFERKHG